MTRSVFTCSIGVALIIGCGGGDGPELGTVEGKVTLDDNPLAGATVTFSPVDGGRQSFATTNDEGYYYLKHTPSRDGALIGKHKVSITTATSKTDADGNDIEVPETLPAKYNAETELEKSVEAGSNEINFDLKSGGRVYKEGDERRQAAPDC